MGSTTSAKPAWTLSPPSAYDIVACWYPESEGVTKIGSLTETYIREYAWLMHKRSSV
jgi:hypothetical protein